MKTTRTPENYCLNCGKLVDAASGQHEHTPKEGDISICFYCSHIMAFDAQLRLRDLNNEEIQYVAGNKKIIKHLEALANFRKEKSKNENPTDQKRG